MPDTTLTSAELDELEALAKAATPGDLDTVNDPPDEYGGKSATGWYECPCCNSVGEVEGVTYSNFDAVAMGVQFFGIGNEHKNYEAFFRSANPATILRLLSLARAGLEAGKAEEPYLVWSNEHRAWWRPNSQGYAKSIEDAGVYTREEATDIARTSRDGWFVDRSPDEIPVAVADIPERMRAAIRALPLTGVDNG